MTAAAAHPFVAELIDRHQETLSGALAASASRDYWSPYPEFPKAYGETGTEDGRAAFEAVLGSVFAIDGQPTDGELVGGESSPYGIELGVSYPHAEAEALIDALQTARPAWAAAGPAARAAVCLEILARINARSHEFAHAVMHTTGQAYGMAFQAGGPHAQDRGLEAVAYAYAEQTRLPQSASWTKPQGKRDPLSMVKEFTVVPRGLALLIGCNTFPTWNGYPGLFASLATGNPVLVKPHPRATLPLALTVRVAREVLTEAGFDPNLVCLAAEHEGSTIAQVLAVRPEVKIIDYTGSTSFGDWLESNAKQAQVYTEKAGVNTVVIDSTDNYRGMLANLAFSLSLYSGQMCTTPQNLLIPRTGITTEEGGKSYDEVVTDLAAAIEGLLADDARAAAILGAVVNPGVLQRTVQAAGGEYGELALTPRVVTSPEFPAATVRTPALIKVDADKPDDRATFLSECFGPVSFAVAVESAEAAVELMRRTVREQGAMTAAGYTVSPEVEAALVEASLDAGVSLSLNLTGGVYANQTAAFSDLHGTGANPAANSAYCDGAFVANRFRVVEVRRHS
ncbi:phenylacetic acid degradation protein PaaN [Kitasatospora atroaurantiaca]|uniref:Phenylacetic acid degradation protein paaN n=1 Tax=Kitasatospora atroaurantiaca TaxID=285545 RepID=A0A561ESV5_9ACTN|nr:phenylacetic acid degradation protein PaaN [Kitasatospora atroaurantiaca]TWE18689.1 phenylacetic acid degradation protein paaN [Kitasatospora atroaurantiaca]